MLLKSVTKTLLCLTTCCIAMTALPAAADTILPPKSTWEYTFTDPTGDATWNTTTGVPGVGGIWSSGPAPFGNTGDPDFGPGTFWPADGTDGDDLWVRTKIDLTGISLPSVTWDLGADNGYKLYANGILVSADNAEGFTFRWEYSGGFGGALTPGMNVIAVALEDHGSLTAFDMQVCGSPVPEPSTMALLGTGLVGLVSRKLRSRKRTSGDPELLASA